ncbi:MAG: hypothetical protein KA767_11870 [Saprospiraceae bacterium]|nr:hypothetical protein [Saprospiraceae bacterium]
MQNIMRIIMALFMIYAGYTHLTIYRIEFQALVPEWVGLEKDFVVVSSGIVEILLGLAFLFWQKRRKQIGWALAIFLILVFFGNVNQYLREIDAFGLTTDRVRLIRLWFQPILVVWALWSSGNLSRSFEAQKPNY